jgi:hypothetical protein
MLKVLSLNNAPCDLVFPGPFIEGICISMNFHEDFTWLPWLVELSFVGFKGTTMTRDALLQLFRCLPQLQQVHLEGAGLHVIEAARDTIGWKCGFHRPTVAISTDPPAAPPRRSVRLLALKSQCNK